MAGVKRAVQRGSCQGPLKAGGVSLRQVFLLQTAVALPLRAWASPNSHPAQHHQPFPRAQSRPAEQSSCHYRPAQALIENVRPFEVRVERGRRGKSRKPHSVPASIRNSDLPGSRWRTLV